METIDHSFQTLGNQLYWAAHTAIERERSQVANLGQELRLAAIEAAHAAWAMEHGTDEIRAAHRTGHTAHGAVRARVIALLADATGVGPWTDEVQSQTDRDSPRLEAVEALERVIAAIDGDRIPLPAGWTLRYDPHVTRADIDPRNDRRLWRTVVVVELATPWGAADIAAVVEAEPDYAEEP